MSQAEQGILWVVATPIGNLSDMSPRAIRTLEEADLVLAEDTRHTAGLLRHFGIETKLKSLHEHNEEARIPALLEQIESGLRVALVSDAGTPAVSDPGGRLAAAALEVGLRISPVPGPCAMAAALSVAGLGSMEQGVMFQGFVPHKGKPRREAIARAASSLAPVILFEAPHRIVRTLEELAELKGERMATLCRELTKVHEEVRRDTLTNLANWSQKGLKGEIVLILGADIAPETSEDTQSMDDAIQKCLAAGLSPRDTAAAVAALLELKKRVVYQRCLALQGQG